MDQVSNDGQFWINSVKTWMESYEIDIIGCALQPRDEEKNTTEDVFVMDLVKQKGHRRIIGPWLRKSNVQTISDMITPEGEWRGWLAQGVEWETLKNIAEVGKKIRGRGKWVRNVQYRVYQKGQQIMKDTGNNTGNETGRVLTVHKGRVLVERTDGQLKWWSMRSIRELSKQSGREQQYVNSIREHVHETDTTWGQRGRTQRPESGRELTGLYTIQGEEAEQRINIQRMVGHRWDITQEWDDP